MYDELKKLESILLKDDKNFRAVMDTSPIMLWLTEKKLTVYFNKSWLKFTGRSLAKELGKGWLDNVHPEDLAFCWRIIPAAFHAQTPYEIEYRLKHHSGKYKWILEQGTPIFTKDGTFKGYVGGCVDIDAQKKIEMRLRESEERYRRLFETAHDGILILDSKTGEITDVNPFLEELLGYSKKEFLGKKLWEVGTFKNIKESKEMFKILQETGYVRYEDLPLETKNGRHVEVEFVSNAYVVGDERVMQCNIRDITERKKIEVADKALLLLEQERVKSIFIADATHELRTPLAIIKGNIDLALRTTKNNKTITDTFKAIDTEVTHLANILSDMTILTTNQNFNQMITTKKINLSDLITRIVKRSHIIALPKNIKIHMKKLPILAIQGNAMYLEKLFSNIIANAIFYGKEKGKVTITTKKEKGRVLISISDNGIGIPAQDIPHIFERFYRTNAARIVNHEGTGLGLAISKWAIEAHSGTIHVTSKEKKGTTFTITLPLVK